MSLHHHTPRQRQRIRATRRTQPYRKGQRKPGPVLDAMRRGRDAFGRNPQDISRAFAHRSRLRRAIKERTAQSARAPTPDQVQARKIAARVKRLNTPVVRGDSPRHRDFRVQTLRRTGSRRVRPPIFRPRRKRRVQRI